MVTFGAGTPDEMPANQSINQFSFLVEKLLYHYNYELNLLQSNCYRRLNHVKLCLSIFRNAHTHIKSICVRARVCVCMYNPTISQSFFWPAHITSANLLSQYNLYPIMPTLKAFVICWTKCKWHSHYRGYLPFTKKTRHQNLNNHKNFFFDCNYNNNNKNYNHSSSSLLPKKGKVSMLIFLLNSTPFKREI